APTVGTRTFFFWYILSIPLLVVALLVAGALGLFQHLAARRKRVASPRASTLIVVSVGGLLVFGAVLVAVAVLPRSLPTGSFVMRFDRSAWIDPRASDFRENDITPRQKMLGDVVTNVIPGKTRTESEQLL